MVKPLQLISFFFLLPAFTLAQWVTYRTSNTAGLGTDLVSSIDENADGSLWFGTDNGVVQYNRTNTTWERFTTQNGLNNDFIYDVKSFNSASVWVATNGGGVSRYTNGSWTSYTTDNGLGSNIVRAITRDNSGKLWFATYGGGLSRFYNNQWTTYDNTGVMPTNYFYSAFTDSDGNLWFGTSNHGVMKFDSVWTNYTATDGLAGNTVLSISETADGRMLFAGTNGVSIYDGTTWQTLTQADGLPASLAYAVMEDAEGDIRIGSENGMSIYDGNSITTLTSASGMGSDKVYCILQDTQENIWLGHLDNGASSFNGTQWLNYHNGTGLLSDYVYKSLEDQSGNMWFITSYGITKYDGLNWITFRELPGMPSYITGNVNDMGIDSDGKIWFALNYIGVLSYDGTNWEHLNNIPGIGNNNIHKILVDSENNVWISTQGTISKYDGTSWTHFRQNSGYFGDYCRAMHQDKTGKIWVASSNGIYVYENNEWQNYASTVFQNNITAITESADGVLWFSYSINYNPVQDAGIMKYDGHWWYDLMGNDLEVYRPVTLLYSSTNELWIGENDYYYTPLTVSGANGIRYYHGYDDIASNYVNDIFEDSHKNIWVCTSNGISMGNLLTLAIDDPAETEISTLNIFPNPFSGQTTLQFEMQSPGDVTLEVYDTRGVLLSSGEYSYNAPGENIIQFDGSNLSTGIYLFKLKTESNELSGKMSILN